VSLKTRELVNELQERQRAEQSLKESEEKYRLLVDNAAEAIFIVQQGKICFANPTFTRLLGVDPLELPNVYLSEFVSQQDGNLLFSLFSETKEKTNGQAEHLLEFKGRHNQSIWFDLNLADITWQQAPGILCLARDITEQKSMEAQLRHSQKMEAIGTLAGGIAHDFNNILGGILGYAELGLLRESQNHSSRKELLGVVSATKKASKLVRQILTFSRHMASELSPLDVNEQVLHSVNLLERTIPKMISIELDLASDLSPVRGDETQLEQMLLNLGGNAKDAMPDGGILKITTYNQKISADNNRFDLSAGDYVVIKVSDTGQGIEPEAMPKIFDPFFTTKDVGKGTGLGLSSVFGVVKGHGGHITCASQPGRGTEFEIFLPATQELKPENGPDHFFSVGQEEALFATILLVDDEKSLRQVGSQVLSANGYRALTADNGENALEIYKKRFKEIDVVVLDVGMPGMGGHQCLAELLAFDPEAKVIIASGYAMQGKLKNTLDLGAKGYLAKPYSQSELLSKIKEVVLDS
jgi:PAS domain S-box-containing protein